MANSTKDANWNRGESGKIESVTVDGKTRNVSMPKTDRDASKR